MDKDQTYWSKRFEKQAKNFYKTEEKYEKELKRQYEKALKSIQEVIFAKYSRYAKDNKLTYQQAQELLDKVDISNLQDKIKAYTKQADFSTNNQLQVELQTLLTKAQITRQQAIESEINIEIYRLYDKQQINIYEILSKGYESSYYGTIYEVQKGLGVGISFSKLSTNQIETAIKYPWSGTDYSTRVWRNTQKLDNSIRDTLTQGLMQGQTAHQMANNLAIEMESGYNSSVRLIRTEYTYVTNQGELKGLNEVGIEKYQYIATLDDRTTDKCKAHDNKVYYLKDAKVGVNYPPLHVNCRSTIVAYFDDEDDIGTRIANQSGNYKVPANMSYEDWYETYVNKAIELPESFDKVKNNLLKDVELNEKTDKLFKTYLSDKYFEVNEQAKKPIGYYPNRKRIVINPIHEAMQNYEPVKMLTHEIVHLIDDKFNLSNKKYSNIIKSSISEAREFVAKAENVQMFNDIFDTDDIYYNMSISDIFSNISNNSIKGAYYHDNEYYKVSGNREKELLADILTEYVTNDIMGLEIIRKIPSLSTLLEEVSKLL